jgi:hypothetical protein
MVAYQPGPRAKQGRYGGRSRKEWAACLVGAVEVRQLRRARQVSFVACVHIQGNLSKKR